MIYIILDEENKKVLASKIDKKWKKSKECSVCGEMKWSMSDNIFSLPQFGPGGQAGKKVYPAVVLTCGECGNSLFFNAMSLGISFKTTQAEDGNDKTVN